MSGRIRVRALPLKTQSTRFEWGTNNRAIVRCERFEWATCPWARRCCGRPPSGRGFLLGAAEKSSLPRTPAAHRVAHRRLIHHFVQVRVNARHVWSVRRPRGECGTRSKMLMPESTVNIWLLDEADCNERSGRQDPPTRRNAKAKIKTQLRKKHARRADHIGQANWRLCSRVPTQQQKQKRNHILTRPAFIHDVSYPPAHTQAWRFLLVAPLLPRKPLTQASRPGERLAVG
jgi:hypothetical protein